MSNASGHRVGGDETLVLLRAIVEAVVAGYEDRAVANAARLPWWARRLLVTTMRAVVVWLRLVVFRAKVAEVWNRRRRPRGGG